MPDLEHLRKQAKLYLRWHRDGYHPVAAKIRSMLPRFRELDDHAVMASPFKLADAQEMVARQAGFESWQALKTQAPPMTSSEIPSAIPSSPITRPVVSQIEAQLYVRDLPAALAFYADALGFETVFVYGEPPFYAQVRRDGARINLRLVCEPVFAGDIREREHLLSASMTLASADALKQLFLELRSAGVTFHQPLTSEPWGARTFVVRDPDGNLLLFSSPAAG